MTTNPSLAPTHDQQSGHQPRDARGRFGVVARDEAALTEPLTETAVDASPQPQDPRAIVLGLDGRPVAAPNGEILWPALDADPAEAQDLLYVICWDPSVDDRTRALAARGAISMSVDRYGALQGLPPGAEDRFREAVTDNDLVLDAVHELGPFAFPQTQEFGDRLPGAVLDLYDRRRGRESLVEQTASRFETAGEAEAYWSSLLADEPAPDPTDGRSDAPEDGDR